MSDSAVDKDFNSNRPTTFLIRDQTFRIRPVKPEEYAGALRRQAELEEQATAKDGDLNLIYTGWDERILQSIDPTDGAHERWRALRSRENDSVTIIEMKDILSWLTEVHTGRPLLWAEPSSTSPGNGAPSSTEPLSSPEVARPS